MSFSFKIFDEMTTEKYAVLSYGAQNGNCTITDISPYLEQWVKMIRAKLFKASLVLWADKWSKL